ncbi:phosphatase PAP2 family protein [Phaeovulum sp.]|uniref:phosphatase PAP2 family protein n=1 Tax=Phaeovulum sp. TaxID=2934796 RepID=UPI003567F47F
MLAAARRLSMRARVAIILAVLALVVAATPREVERYGDNLQIALPALAIGCSVLNGDVGEYLARYVVMFTGVHGTKRALGDAPINLRPSGSLLGFPSGHTATAAFGASALVQSCITGHPVAKTVVILAAAFTGASRIEANAHTIWQVLAGAIWGIFCDRFLRPGSPWRGPVLRRLSALWRRGRTR